MEKQMIDRYTEQLVSAKRHCLLSLLDYADALKKSDSSQKDVLENMKKRIHNDIAGFHQVISNLLTLALLGGEIPPLGNGNHTS